MVIKIKLVHPLAQMPRKVDEADACYDLFPVDMTVTDNYVEYDLGFQTEFAKSYMAEIFPRSSVSKMDLLMCNPPGIIDSGYRGNWKIRFKRTWGPTITLLKDSIDVLAAAIQKMEDKLESTPGWKFWKRKGLKRAIKMARNVNLTMGMRLQELMDEEKLYDPKSGKAIAQMTVRKLPVIQFKQVEEELKESSRGDKGFGSTDAANSRGDSDDDAVQERRN
jgi:dUTPase